MGLYTIPDSFDRHYVINRLPLKSELLYLKKYTSMIEFERDLIQYIDYYNKQRVKIKLNGMSPSKFREHYWVV